MSTRFRKGEHPSPSTEIKLGQRLSPKTEIKKLSVPVLIVQGTTDIQVNVDEAEKLKKAYPKATYAVITGMNHPLKPAPQDREQNMATYSNPTLPLSAGLVPAITTFVQRTVRN